MTLKYKSAAECKLRQVARAEANLRGITNEHQLLRIEDAEVKRLGPLMTHTDLDAAAILDLRTAMAQPSVGDKESAARTQSHLERRVLLSETPAERTANTQAAWDAAMKVPVLKAALSFGNAANSVPVADALFRNYKDQQSRRR